MIHGALVSVEAVHRDLAGRSMAPNASLLLGTGHNLFMTRSGPLDVLGTIGRGRDFSALSSRSRPIDLDALIDIRREVAREIDLATLPILVRTLEERRKRDG